MALTLREKQQERGNLQDEAGALIKRTTNEKRSMTSTERSKFQEINAKMLALTGEIDAEAREMDSVLARASAQRQHAGGDGGIVTEDTTVLRPEQRFVDWAQANGRSRPEEYPGLTIGGFLRSMVVGPRNEVEKRALSEGTDSAGGYTVPTYLSAQLIDQLRSRTVAFKAGAQTVPLNTHITYVARIATDPTSVWHGENASETPSTGTFDRIQFTAKTLLTLTTASRELLDDSVNVDDALTRSLLGAMAVKLDQAILVGDGTGNSPTGIKNTAGVGSVSMGTNGAAPSAYTPFLSAWQTIREANNQDDLQAVMSPRSENEFASLRDGQAQPLRRPELIADMPFFSTTSIVNTETQGTSSTASRIIVGDYTDCLVGIRNDIRIEVIRERYADAFQYGFLAWMRADVQLAHPGSFCQIVGVL